jgi:two-component system OmpR family response regulator
MKIRGRILLAEDDENLAFLVKENLESVGYEIKIAANGEQAFRMSMAEKFDMYILDVMMPRRDGYWVAEQIRKRDYETPIIFLTAKNSELDRIQGFTVGSDDYITKPFSIKELLLRLSAILKRTMPTRLTTDVIFSIGKFTFDYVNRSISMGSKSTHLNIKEAELLKLLVENKNNIITRRSILLKIWGNDDYFVSRSMDVYITRLRKILRPDPSLEIQNVYGTGFKLLEKE